MDTCPSRGIDYNNFRKRLIDACMGACAVVAQHEKLESLIDF